MSLRDTVDFVLLAALWGASFMFMRVAGPEFGPGAMIALRVAVAAAALLPLWWLRSTAAERDRARVSAAPIARVGFMGSAVPFTLLAYATIHLGAGFTGLINAATPMAAGVVGALLFGVFATRRQWSGLLLGAFGIGVLSWDRLSAPTSQGAELGAMVAGVLATVAYGYTAHDTRHRLSDVSPLTVAAGGQLAAAVALLPALVLGWPERTPSAAAWGAVVALGLGCTGLAYLLYFRLIQRLGGQRAAAVTLLIPLFAVGFGVLVLDETLSWRMGLGGAIVLAGTTLAVGRRSSGR